MACSFQPTRPAWGATMTPREQHSFLQFQSTRPAWGATVAAAHDGQLEVVSIHAPRVGRDGDCAPLARAVRVFQSTRPAWGATGKRFGLNLSSVVSIHAPRVGRDRLG